MRKLIMIALACAACNVPDKRPITGDGGTTDGDTPGGPVETTLTDVPAEFSNTGIATFSFTSNVADAHFECRIDEQPPAPCMSPFAMQLADGTHSFSVRAIDNSGNGDDTPAEHLWMIDTVAPGTTLTEAPPAADNSTMVTFAFSSNEQTVTFECSLDGAAFSTCRSGDQVGPIGDGAHSFAVRARDRAGNVDASPAIHAWSVDTSTPDTTLLSGPSGAVATATASFTFYSPDAGPGATFQCSLDGSAFATCVSPQDYTVAMGVHTFAVRVRDAVGNLDPTPATRTWIVDLTPPETTITDGPSGVVGVASASISFTSNEEGAVFVCSLDGSTPAPCTSPYNVTMLGQGAHTFVVDAIDIAGHMDPTPASISWTVDTIAPDITLLAGPADGSTTGPFAWFMFTTTEGTLSCSLDGAAFSSCMSPIGYNLPAGQHTWSVRATDAGGNTTTVTRTWTVACGAPDATGAAGLLHLDDTGQILANATGGATATLGPTDQAEPQDPTPTTGRFGGALAFAPAEGDLVAWPILLGATTVDFALELWARPDAASGTRDIVVSGDGRIALRVSAASATTVRFSATVVASGGVMHTVTSQPVAAGTWHWVLVSLQEPTLRLWVDGVGSELGEVRLTTIPTLDAIQLGGNYSGALDEVWLSQTAITTEEAARTRYCPL